MRSSPCGRFSDVSPVVELFGLQPSSRCEPTTVGVLRSEEAVF